jgi:hypothetical protein
LSYALFAVCAISRQHDALRDSLRWLAFVLADRIAQAAQYVHFVMHVQSSGVGQFPVCLVVLLVCIAVSHMTVALRRCSAAITLSYFHHAVAATRQMFMQTQPIPR